MTYKAAVTANNGDNDNNDLDNCDDEDIRTAMSEGIWRGRPLCFLQSSTKEAASSQSNCPTIHLFTCALVQLAAIQLYNCAAAIHLCNCAVVW